MSIRKYRNQEVSGPLIEALNGSLGSPFATRLAETLNAAKSVTGSWPRNRGSVKTLNTINAFFVQYKMYPHFSSGDEVPFETLWTSDNHDERELDAVLALHDLIAYEWPDQVQPCESCKKWFYKRFSHQKVCDELCRDKLSRSPEKLKEKREYMRNLRQLEKDRRAREDAQRAQLAKSGRRRTKL